MNVITNKLKLYAFLSLVVLSFGCNGKQSDVKITALLIHGGTIITMDPDNPVVESMLIENGVISAVGPLEELMSIAANTKQLNLQGKTLMPGFIDSHVHVHQLGAEKIKANLVGTNSVKEMGSRLRTFYPNPKVGQWLIGQGWDEGKWATKGYPDRSLLDKAFPENPVYLLSLHGFGSFYNKTCNNFDTRNSFEGA